jgi:hypothetical protein
LRFSPIFGTSAIAAEPSRRSNPSEKTTLNPRSAVYANGSGSPEPAEGCRENGIAKRKAARTRALRTQEEVARKGRVTQALV